MILLVVDTQRGCFNDKLYAYEIVRTNIKKLIEVARKVCANGYRRGNH